MADRLKDKVAMIVGAGSIGPGWGNGKATAVACAREGAKVFCVDINLAAAEETANIITSARAGSRCPISADVSKNDDVEAMVKACIADFGRIDVLDNNVGIAEVGGVVEMDEEAWDKRHGRQSQERVPDDEARHPDDDRAGRRLDHQYLVDRGDPLHRRAVFDLLRLEGRASPPHAHDRGRVCAQQECARERDLARPDADADGRALGGPRASPMRAAMSRRCAKKRAAQVPMGFGGSGWDVAWAVVFLASDESRYITGHRPGGRRRADAQGVVTR